MAILPIVQYPDNRLTKNCAPVEQFDNTLRTLTQDLTETLYGTTGIGLSAPQVGCLMRFFVMDLSDDKSSPEVFINPEITKKSGLGIADEACLSLPGINAKVMRSGFIHVRAQDLSGQFFEKELDGMSAICVQHEIDHLDGILFIDRISAIRRFPMRKQLENLRAVAIQTDSEKSSRQSDEDRVLHYVPRL